MRNPLEKASESQLPTASAGKRAGDLGASQLLQRAHRTGFMQCGPSATFVCDSKRCNLIASFTVPDLSTEQPVNMQREVSDRQR